MTRSSVLSWLPVCAVLACTCSTYAVDLQPKMGEPLAGLSVPEIALFMAGKAQFVRIPTIEEGRGPLLNQNSCGSCHNNPVGGTGSIMVTRFGLFDEKGGGFDPLEDYGGSLLQSQSISEGCAETIPDVANVIAQRVTTSSLGLGLIEAIPDSAILANANPGGAGISGKAHMVAAAEDPPNSPLRVGRFGWKAQVATVLTFSGDAAVNEMGITNRLFPDENDPNGIFPPTLAACDTVADPEDHADGEGFHFIDRLTHFQRYLAAPPQTPKSGMTGETLFNSVGCNSCHVTSFTTADTVGLEPAIRNKVIKPYSDFLLHDMGLLGDGIWQGDAEGREMRTPPLWGLSRRDPLLHDGRVAGNTFAARITGAIAQHNVFGSEAAPSAVAYNALNATQKSQVIAFLASLGRAEFDFNDDLVIDVNDFTMFKECYQGSGPYDPDHVCAIADVDQDGDVDDDDFNLFVTVYVDANGDCNSNVVADLRDILAGTSTDCNSNGVPDECDAESYNVGLFVAILLEQNNDRIIRCMLDKNQDGEVDGRDVQPFILGILGP